MFFFQPMHGWLLYLCVYWVMMLMFLPCSVSSLLQYPGSWLHSGPGWWSSAAMDQAYNPSELLQCPPPLAPPPPGQQVTRRLLIWLLSPTFSIKPQQKDVVFLHHALCRLTSPWGFCLAAFFAAFFSNFTLLASSFFFADRILLILNPD